MTYIVHEPDWEAVLKEAESSYYKLVLIVGSVASGKTALLKDISSSFSFGHLNLGEELARRLMVRPQDTRNLEAEELTADLIHEMGTARVAIDNTEILFESPIQLNPLTVLKKLSRTRAIVATWTGSFDESKLTYGFHGHPAYREYSFTPEDVIIIVPSRPTP